MSQYPVGRTLPAFVGMLLMLRSRRNPTQSVLSLLLISTLLLTRYHRRLLQYHAYRVRHFASMLRCATPHSDHCGWQVDSLSCHQ